MCIRTGKEARGGAFCGSKWDWSNCLGLVEHSAERVRSVKHPTRFGGIGQMISQSWGMSQTNLRLDLSDILWEQVEVIEISLIELIDHILCKHRWDWSNILWGWAG